MKVSKTKQAQRRHNRRKRNTQYRDRIEEIKCFWTWPLGHSYDGMSCVGCGYCRSMY